MGSISYVPHNNLEFCCKSMGAFWTHNNKHEREVPVILYGVLTLIQDAQIFAWIGGEHISCHMYHTYQQSEHVRRYEGPNTANKLKYISIEHCSVSSISFCSRYAFILRVIRLLLYMLWSFPLDGIFHPFCSIINSIPVPDLQGVTTNIS